jgi:hypothetical protein
MSVVPLAITGKVWSQENLHKNTASVTKHWRNFSITHMTPSSKISKHYDPRRVVDGGRSRSCVALAIKDITAPRRKHVWSRPVHPSRSGSFLIALGNAGRKVATARVLSMTGVGS